MRVVAIGATDEAAALPEAFGMLKRGNLAGNQEITGNGVSVIDIAKAGVALGTHLDRFRTGQRFRSNGQAPRACPRACHGFDVIAGGSVAAFAANTAMLACAQSAGLSVANQAPLFKSRAEDAAKSSFQVGWFFDLKSG